MTRLAPCPSSPNCVSSVGRELGSELGPIPLDRSADEAVAAIKRVVLGLPGSRLVSEEASYVRFEFRSFLGFVDDVEFAIDPGEKRIDFRSASRVGYYDFGANRARIKRIMKLLS